MQSFGWCLRRATLLVALASMSACVAVQGVPDRSDSIDVIVSKGRDALASIEAAYYSSQNEQQRLFYRNEYVARKMHLIDVHYTQFEASLTSEGQKINFSTSVASQVLSATGALVTPASTTQILSGLAATVDATRGFYNSDIVVAKTIQIVQGLMRAQRDQVATRIAKRKFASTTAYTLSDALRDLEDYYRAGTFTTGLMEAVSDAGEAAETARSRYENESIRLIRIHDANVPLPVPQRGPIISDSVRVGEFEGRLVDSEKIKMFQEVVGVTTDGDFGPETKAAILTCLGTLGEKDPSFSDRITSDDGNVLEELHEQGVRSCVRQ